MLITWNCLPNHSSFGGEGEAYPAGLRSSKNSCFTTNNNSYPGQSIFRPGRCTDACRKLGGISLHVTADRPSLSTVERILIRPVPSSARAIVARALKSRYGWFGVAAISALLVLSGCGGGDSGGGAKGLTATVNSINETADTSDGAPSIVNPFSINVPTSGSYFFKISLQGTAGIALGLGFAGVSIVYNSGNSTLGATPELAAAIGESMYGNWSGNSFSIVSIGFANPKFLGAGTYHDQIVFEACQDAACTQPLFGGPLSIPVTYVITGNPTPAMDALIGSDVTLEAPASQTTPVSGSIPIEAIDVPPTGAYVTIGPSTTGLVTQTSFTATLGGPSAIPSSQGTIGFVLQPPADLGAGIHTDTFPINVCFDEACTKPDPQGPWTGTITYIVDPVAGQDYSQTSLGISVRSIAWDNQTSRLYVTTQGYSEFDPNELLQINPFTGMIDTAIQLDGGTGQIGALAASDDGQYLYVAVSDVTGLTNHIERLRTSDLGLDLTINLQAAGTVQSLEPAPGAPHTLAVLVSGPPATLAIYNDATALADTLVGSTSTGEFVWGNDATTLYVGFYPQILEAASVSASGLQLTQSFDSELASSGASGGIHFADNIIYWDSGTVFDTATATLKTQFAASSTCDAAVDASLGRIFFSTSEQPAGAQAIEQTIKSFNLSSGAPIWLARFPQQNCMEDLTRWGPNGLAFAGQLGGTDALIMLSGAIVTH